MDWISDKQHVSLKSGKSVQVIFEGYFELPPDTVVRGSCSCVKPKIEGNLVIVKFSPSFPKHLPGPVHLTKKTLTVYYPDNTEDILTITGEVTR